MANGYYFRDGEDCPLVTALELDVLESGVDLSVSSRDEMFKLFFYEHGEAIDASLIMYLESGKRIWRTLRQVLEWRFGRLEQIDSLLDLAAGYGRVTRFAVGDIAAERIWIAEIDEEAVRFQKETFGVHGLQTTARPEDFSPDRSFDCILVSSLFTHLPEERFGGWLRRLLSLVNPGGLLAFSVHDLALCPEAGGSSFVFAPQSESASLDGREYGSTWVGESYVRERIDALREGRDLRTLRVPRALANYQDLYVVLQGSLAGADDGGDDGALRHLRGGADGFLEACYLSAGRELELRGWVTDRVTKLPIREVVVTLDGIVATRTHSFSPRPDVAAAFLGDAGVGQGWRITITLPRRCDFQRARLRIVAIGNDRFETCLDEMSIQEILSRGALLQWRESARACRSLQAEAERLQNLLAENRRLLEDTERSHGDELQRWTGRAAGLAAQVEAVQASRFWKLRDRWFALKRRLRLTDEA